MIMLLKSVKWTGFHILNIDFAKYSSVIESFTNSLINIYCSFKGFYFKFLFLTLIELHNIVLFFQNNFVNSQLWSFNKLVQKFSLRLTQFYNKKTQQNTCESLKGYTKFLVPINSMNWIHEYCELLKRFFSLISLHYSNF